MAAATQSHGWLWCAGLVLLTALAYGAFVDGPWVYEDANWLTFVADPVTDWTPPSRALTSATYHWAWQIAGREPALYRLGNLGLHLTNGVLVYALAASLLSPAAAAWSAGIFLLHPLNSEAVRYASARSDLLLTTFVLLAAWISLGRFSARRWLALALALLGASVSKEIGLVAIPLAAVTVAVWRPTAVSTKMVAPLWIALGALAGATIPILVPWIAMSPKGGGTFFTWPEFALLQMTAIWHLLALVPWPDGFSIDHDVVGLGLKWTLVAALLTAQAVVAIAWTWRRAPVVAWALLWVAAAVLPRLVFRTNEFITEPQMYTAMAGVSVLIGAGVARLWAWRPQPSALVEFFSGYRQEWAMSGLATKGLR